MSNSLNMRWCATLVSIFATGCTLIFGIEEGTLDGSGAAGTGGEGAAITSAGSDPGGSGAGGANGGGGSGGDGGQGAGITCTALAPFDAMTAAEVNDLPLDDENIFTATRPDDNRVHVAINIGGGGGGRQIAARTVRIQAVIDKSPVVIYPAAPDGADRRISGVYATNDEFRVFGIENNFAGEFVFRANSDIGDPSVSFSPYPEPVACGNIQALSVHVGFDNVPRFAASCTTAGVNPPQAYLYGGRTDGALEFTLGPVGLDGDGNVPADMNVRTYLRMGTEHVIIVGEDDFTDAQPFLRHGSTEAQLANAQPIQSPPAQALLFIDGPNTAGDKVFLGALHVDPNSILGTPDGGYATGILGLDELPGLVSDPITTLGNEFELTTLEEVAPPFAIKANGSLGFIGGGASNFDITKPSRARLFLWDAEGVPLVVGFPVFEGAPDQILTATAAPAGFGGSASLWVEQTNGIYTMRGARVQCTGN